jgi:hypothetical protein
LEHCRHGESNFRDSFFLWLYLLKRSSVLYEYHYLRLVHWCLELGFLAEAELLVGFAQKIAKESRLQPLFNELIEFAEFHAVMNNFQISMRYVRKFESKLKEGTDENYSRESISEAMLLQGNFEFAREHGKGWVHSEARLQLGEVDAAIDELHVMLVEAREKSWHKEELQIRRVLAEAYRRKGAFAAARDVIDDFWGLARRGPYRLLIADMYNVLAEVERDCGNLPEAVEAASEAYRQAWCDGPPHAYKRALDKVKALLDSFRSPYPEPPPRDTSYDDIFRQIPRPKTKS